MRSVVVVLPASMWAMIPMFRVRASGWGRLSVSASAVWQPLLGSVRGGCRSCRPRAGAFEDRATARLPGRPGFLALPAVVREGLVRLRHLLEVVAALHGGPDAVAGVEQLVGQALGHGLLA